MKAFRATPIALLLASAGSCAIAADDGALGLKPDSGGVHLKLQPSFLRIQPGSKDVLPVFVDADSIQGHQDREIEAEGDVRLRRRGQAVFADWLRYDKPEDEIQARGNVRLEQRGDVVEGTGLKYKIDAERGTFDKPKYQVQVNATRGRGEAQQFLFEGQNKYRLLGGSYTSCDLGVEDWYLRARDFEIDKDRQIGTARDASVEFLGHTILYTPYMSFSLDRQRKSGFLSPTFGTTGNSGYEFSIPYYWNIAPNRDATFTPRVMSKRGDMLNTEFRYLEPRYYGTLVYEVLPQDRVKDDANRFALNFRHNQMWDNGLSGYLNIQKVSDDTYFTDLSTQVSSTSQVLLPREGGLAKSGNWWNGGTWNATATMQRWQTLQTDPLNPLTPPYNRLQTTLTAGKQNVGFADLDLFSSAAQFTHPTLVNGRRVVVYPSLSVPLQTSFAYVTPKVGVHLTHYDFDQTNTTLGDQNRSVPIFSTESGVVFERGMTFAGQSLTQTLEPKIYYLYIPTRNQNQIPNFDSGQQNINFATLYSENQFSGNDRINDANQLTAGMTSRLLQADSGVERLRAGFAQRYYFKTQEVTLPGAPVRASNASDLLAALSGTVAPHWTAEAGMQYATDISHTQRFALGTRYQPEPGSVINLAYRYTNGNLVTPTSQTTVSNPVNPANTLRQVDFSTQWPIKGRISAVARWNYSIADSRLLEGLGGFEYNGGCWAFRLVAHRFATTNTTQVSSLYAQLELNGVSKIGSNPLDMLKRSIGGYARPELQTTTRPDDLLLPVR